MGFITTKVGHSMKLDIHRMYPMTHVSFLNENHDITARISPELLMSGYDIAASLKRLEAKILDYQIIEAKILNHIMDCK